MPIDSPKEPLSKRHGYSQPRSFQDSANEFMVDEELDGSSLMEKSLRVEPGHSNRTSMARSRLWRTPEADLTGAVQPAMAALECVARSACGDEKATLGEAIKRCPGTIPKPLVHIPPSMKRRRSHAPGAIGTCKCPWNTFASCTPSSISALSLLLLGRVTRAPDVKPLMALMMPRASNFPSTLVELSNFLSRPRQFDRIAAHIVPDSAIELFAHHFERLLTGMPLILTRSVRSLSVEV
jgi:hypothetical protein